MLSVYTRHSKNCAKKEDINWRRCRCPKWINGTLDSRFIRKTAKTRSWEKDEDLKRHWEEAATPKKLEPVTIEEAVGAYLADAKARELRESTLYKLEILFRRQFLAWAKDKGLCFLKEIDLPLLRDYRATWKDGALAKKKKQERLIGFFWFCVRAGWLTTNPTQGLGKIAVDPTPTDYFTPKEIDAILDATYVYRENRWEQGDRNGTRLRALTLLMRWSGLRIRDAITLERSRLVGGHQGAHASLYHFITLFHSPSLKAMPLRPASRQDARTPVYCIIKSNAGICGICCWTIYSRSCSLCLPHY